MNWELEYMYGDVSLLLLSLFIINSSAWPCGSSMDPSAGIPIPYWVPVAVSGFDFSVRTESGEPPSLFTTTG